MVVNRGKKGIWVQQCFSVWIKLGRFGGQKVVTEIKPMAMPSFLADGNGILANGNWLLANGDVKFF